MTLRLIVNNQDVAPLLSGPPKIGDELDSTCRTLDFTLQAADGLVNYLGQSVQLYLGGQRWYYGFLEIRGWEANGQITYRVYDPLYFFGKNPTDFYFKGVTADQAARQVCETLGIMAGPMASTGYVMPAKFYPKTEGDKVITDSLYLTKQANGKAFWYRFNPEDGPNFGCTLFERTVPAEMWAFQRGVNLSNARYEESLEETYNIIKLINRETGRAVVKTDTESIAAFGPRTYFDEVDKDHEATMDQDAVALLEEKNKVKITMSAEGINAALAMPQFYSGDVIFIEEDVTGEFGPYFIKSVSQTILDSKNVQLAFDVESDPSIARVKIRQLKEKKAKAKAKQAPKSKEKDATAAASTPGNYSPEMAALMEKYGLNK